ncbi:hypothetical protein [Streptococcus sp.]|uniref:hypothetical protein n=1 Tax=Streptococcus sp. TaxID=1306 RepID=UPI0025DB7572|nr:hypothetical protein [Streptococcus sp.]
MTTDIKTEIGHRVRQERERHKLTREEVRMTTDIKTEIGHRVRQERERHKLTREEVCGQKLN